MAEELRYYYNEGLDQIANAESFGTPLGNTSDELMHIRRIELSCHSEEQPIEEACMIEATKRSSRSQSVGHNPPGVRLMGKGNQGDGATATNAAGDGNSTAQRQWVFPRGAFTLETGETLYNHLTYLKGLVKTDIFVDVWYHY